MKNSLLIIVMFGLCSVTMAQDRFNVSLLDRYTAATIRTVRVESGIAYVMRELNGLDILDVSNPIDIQLLRHMALAGFTNDAVVSGDRLYLTFRYDGVQIYDRTDPDSLVLLGTFDTPGMALVVKESQGILYLADGDALRIYDVLDPELPELIGTLALPGTMVDIQLELPLAYVSGSLGGLHVVDVSNPFDPVLVSTVNTPGAAHGAVIHNGFAYIGDYWGLAICDISNPEAPISYPSLPLPHISWDAAVLNDTLYVGNGNFGLKVFELTDPTVPHLIGWYDPPTGNSGRTVIEDGHVFVAEWDRLAIYQWGDSVLPVELLDFSGESVGNGIRLQWETASETNVSSFEIWRAEGNDFSLLTEIGRRGNSTSGAQYTFVDNTVTENTSYSYFLTVVNLDGSREELRERMVTASWSGAAAVPDEFTLKAYPNPFNPMTTIEFTMPEAGNVSLKIFDNTGRVVETMTRAANAGTVSFEWNAEGRTSGTYFARVASSGVNRVVPLVLLK